MILAKEATRVEVANDTANVVDLVQGRRYEIFRDNQNIHKQSSSLIVYVWKMTKMLSLRVAM